MKILVSIQTALRYMKHNPLRTLLMLQGIIWATAVVIFPPSIQEGSRKNARQHAEKLALDTLSVRVEHQLHSNALTADDITALRNAFKKQQIRSLTPFIIRRTDAYYKDQPYSTTVIATDQTAHVTRNMPVKKGRYLNDDDIRNKRQVCVIESSISKKMFGTENPCGEQLYLEINDNKLLFTIIGLVQELPEERVLSDDYGFRRNRRQEMVQKLKFMAGIDQQQTDWKRNETAFHIPITLMPEPERFDWIIAKADPDQLQQIAAQMQQIMVNQGKKTVVVHNLIYPLLLGNKLKVSNELSFALFLLCLIMGGIMVMNIMLVSVTERTREIGIRRAEGATRIDIILLFLAEGILLCIAGAIIGIPLGVLLARIAAYFEPYVISTSSIPVKQSFFALCWAVGIGLVSSIIPAVRAANMPPAQTLKHE